MRVDEVLNSYWEGEPIRNMDKKQLLHVIAGLWFRVNELEREVKAMENLHDLSS